MRMERDHHVPILRDRAKRHLHILANGCGTLILEMRCEESVDR